LDEWITDRLEKGSVSRMPGADSEVLVLDPKPKIRLAAADALVGWLENLCHCANRRV